MAIFIGLLGDAPAANQGASWVDSMGRHPHDRFQPPFAPRSRESLGDEGHDAPDRLGEGPRASLLLPPRRGPTEAVVFMTVAADRRLEITRVDGLASR